MNKEIYKIEQELIRQGYHLFDITDRFFGIAIIAIKDSYWYISRPVFFEQGYVRVVFFKTLPHKTLTGLITELFSVDRLHDEYIKKLLEREQELIKTNKFNNDLIKELGS